ncbi:Six-hairpin glycosidase-like protein [Aspergillus coremiiformis]|uniref:Six-hairpin glycosidase-like protein n=1 Tax=Aspergillus coremiiformis TaxID=138285 RepID=A0A5N6Z2E4_9EURO|nr:Six-hairpin glycosidase-like protein [Aspergillus coremiiformis]
MAVFKRTIRSSLLVPLLLPWLGAVESAPSSCNVDARPHSAWMADSVISRRQAVLPPGTTPEPSTFLQIGTFQNAILRLKEYYSSSEHACAHADWDDYLAESTQDVIPWLLNATKDVQSPLDRFSDGKALLYQYQITPNETYKATLDALHQSIYLQPRNEFGGYWYYKYPYWSYLDGMYSLIPFYSLYTSSFASANSTAVATDLVQQLDLLWSHCRQNSTGLLVHGYDALKQASWAHPVTGASPIVWIRALGWYFMALVDILELSHRRGVLSQDQWSHIHQQFLSLSDAVMAVADPETGCWWQVMTDAKREGNYIESSGSAMLTYALYKGARLGYLKGRSHKNPQPSAVASKCYRHLASNFVVHNPNGTLDYNGTVAVCSLNSTATYEYYVHQPLLYNSVFGSASFILASLEHEIAANMTLR